MSLIGEAFANGILLGGIFALSAVGFSLIFGVMDILNLTHGAVVILSAFLSYFGLEIYGIDPFVSIVPIMGVMFVAGYGFQRLVISRILDAEILVTLLVTFGFALMIRNAIELTVTATPRSISPPYAREAIQTGIFGPIPVVRLGGLVVALVLFAVLGYFLRSTEYGRKIRATAESPEVAELCGIDTNHIYGITFGVGTALAAAAGVLVGLATTFQPIDEGIWTLYAFVVVILGGFGKPEGALVGGILLGLTWSFTTIYIGTQFAAMVSFGILVVMLLVRPQGLLGGWEN
jgi:branched-chain amino acid transport system permease protein